MERPYVICHMLASVDGKIDGTWFNAAECSPALQAYGELRTFFDCQATLYGTTTMKGGYSNGIVKEVPHSTVIYPKEDYIAEPDFGNYIVSLDPKGILGWDSGFIEKKGRPKAHVIEVLTEAVDSDYLAYLRKYNISYIFAGNEEFDCSMILEKLSRYFSIKKLMIAGGGITNWSFTKDGLVDELSLVMAPVSDGDSYTATIFETVSKAETVKAFRLISVKALDGDAIWLRYHLIK